MQPTVSNEIGTGTCRHSKSASTTDHVSLHSINATTTTGSTPSVVPVNGYLDMEIVAQRRDP